VSLTPVANGKKSSIIIVLIILIGHLLEVELTYRYIFAFKFTLRSQQPDIVPTISSLGRYVFGSEISYNKPPPRLPGLGC
jgi:hypothetical protein